MPTPSKELGDKGERLAAAFLIAKDYAIVQTNLRLAGGEIDILARDPDGTLVVVEVKTRSSSTFVRPAANITPHKLQTLQRLALVVAGRYPETNVRVDVIEVDGSDEQAIHHTKDVLN